MNSGYREYTYCPVCGQKLPDEGGRRSCHKCGSDFEEVEKAKKFKFCPRCAAPLMDGKEYCRVCGMHLYPSSGSRYCASCGHEVYAEAVFCPYCGCKIARGSYASYPGERPGAYNAGHSYAEHSSSADTTRPESGPTSNDGGYSDSRRRDSMISLPPQSPGESYWGIEPFIASTPSTEHKEKAKKSRWKIFDFFHRKKEKEKPAEAEQAETEPSDTVQPVMDYGEESASSEDTVVIDDSCESASGDWEWDNSWDEADSILDEIAESSGTGSAFFEEAGDSFWEDENSTDTAEVCGKDKVKFSAVYKNQMRPGEKAVISIVMFEEAYRYAVDMMLRQKTYAPSLLESDEEEVGKGTKVSIILTADDLIIDDRVSEKIWQGKYRYFDYLIEVPSAADKIPEEAAVKAEIYFNGYYVSRLLFTVRLKEAGTIIDVARQDVETAFVSYASRDFPMVSAFIQGMREMTNADIFIDKERLKSGYQWKEQLKKEISDRDVFYLCWSTNASKSKYVDMEWRYAYQEKGRECIHTVPIEPAFVCKLPPELEDIHCSDQLAVLRVAIQIIENARQQAHDPTDSQR